MYVRAQENEESEDSGTDDEDEREDDGDEGDTNDDQEGGQMETCLNCSADFEKTSSSGAVVTLSQTLLCPACSPLSACLLCPACLPALPCLPCLPACLPCLPACSRCDCLALTSRCGAKRRIYEVNDSSTNAFLDQFEFNNQMNTLAEPLNPYTDFWPRTTSGDLSAYYTWSGSLTTPPCTEGLKWHLFTQPVTMSTKQLAAYQASLAVSAPRTSSRSRI